MTDLAAARRLVDSVTEAWARDPESDVEWSGDHEGRRGVRMHQTVRDYTTVWFGVGERTVTVEAFVLPVAPGSGAEVLRQALVRNFGTRRIHFALDRDGDLVLTGKIPLDELDEQELELGLGEVYALVELSFRPMVRVMMREKSD